MRLLPTSDQITEDLNDLKLRIAKMKARRNAQINLLQRKVMGGSLRSKYYPWSREYNYRRLYNTYPSLYPFGAYPWRSSSLDSLELDKYYDSLNLDDKPYTYEPDDQLYSKYKRIAKTYPPNTDLLSKLKDFIFEQERQMTNDLLRKITEERKLRPTERPNLYSRESKSLSRVYDAPQKNDPPFLNPINKKDNFYKRYNAFIKKILKPLRRSSPVKYDLPKPPRIPKTTSLSPTKTNYLSKSYLDDYNYYYPSQSYRPYWYRCSSYPYYRRYLYDYDYLPKVQPASVPLDVESIICKSNNEDRNYKPIKKNYVAPTCTYKYDPFQSDSYLRSSLPTWKQYYYTQKLKSKPSSECFLDYYDPYYDFFPDRASADSTDDLLSNEEAQPEQSDDANQLVDEYRDAIYEDIIQNLREKQLKRNKNTPLRADRQLFGYRVNDRAEHPTRNYFTSEPYSNLYRPTYASNVYGTAESYPQKFPTYNYYPKDDIPTRTTYSKPNFEQHGATDQVKDIGKASETPNIDSTENVINDFSPGENYNKTKLEDDSKTLLSDTQTRQNVVSPSIFHAKCTTPVNSTLFNKYSTGNLSPSKTKITTSNIDGKLSPRNASKDASPEKKLERYRSSNTLHKIRSSPTYDENKHKYDSEPKRISEYKSNSSSINEYKADTFINQYKPDISVGQYKPNTSVDQYEGDTSVGQYKGDTSFDQHKDDTSKNQYKPDTSFIGEYKPDTSQARFANSKIENPSNEYQSFPIVQQPSDKFTPINSPTKPRPSGELRRLSYYPPENEIASDKFTPINSPTKPRPTELRKPSNYPSENEIPNSSNLIPTDSEKLQQKNSLTEKRNESLTNETLPESRFQRLSFTSSIGAGNRDPSNVDFTNKYSSDPAQRLSNSPTVKKQTRLSASETGDRLWLDERPTEPRRGSSTDPAPEIRRSSTTRSKQPTPNERSTLSRRNSIVYDGNKSSSSLSASRRNSIKLLQRRNSIQPASEKRNLLQKMNHETKYDGDEQSPFSNENSAESYSIEEQAEVNKEVPYRSLTQFQKKLSKDDVFSGVDELARKNMDTAKHNTYIADDYQPVYQYDLNPNEEPDTIVQKTFAPLPQTNYYDENPSSFEENSKDSYGRDDYNAKEQQFYPENNDSKELKPDSTIPQGSYTEQTHQEDPNYSSLDSYQKSYTQGESYPNDYSGYYNQNQSAPLNYIPDEYNRSQDQQQPQSGHFDSYGDQEHPSLVSQSSNDSHSRKSFQQSEENTDVDLSINQSPVRSYESKEQEQSLNSINEETEKLDEKPRKDEEAITNAQQTSAERAAATTTTSTKPKRSVDYGKSTVPPRELSRRSSRSTLLSQSSEDKKFKTQSSAGELQKRMSKPKIGESKLRRTASTFKVKPTGVTKKT